MANAEVITAGNRIRNDVDPSGFKREEFCRRIWGLGCRARTLGAGKNVDSLIGRRGFRGRYGGTSGHERGRGYATVNNIVYVVGKLREVFDDERAIRRNARRLLNRKRR